MTCLPKDKSTKEFFKKVTQHLNCIFVNEFQIINLNSHKVKVCIKLLIYCTVLSRQIYIYIFCPGCKSVFCFHF